MTTNLKPRVLDIIVTRITAKTVYYELAANRKAELWRVPPESSFDINTLVEGQRYRVTTKTIRTWAWSYKAQQHVWMDSYEWVHVEMRAPKARVTATAKRSGPDLPLADGGEIFGW